MAYKAGGFYMPTSPGPFVVDGLGFTPQGVMFMGGNQAAEDVVLSPSNAGAFFGMAWRDVLTDAIDQQALFSGAPTMFNFRPSAITCAASSGSVQDYRADIVSFDGDGFTLNVTTPAPGARPIHYLAWGEFEGAHGTGDGVSFDNAHLTFNLPYRPGVGLMYHFWPTGGVRDRIGNGGNYFSMGVGNWPRELLTPSPHGPVTHGGASAIRVFSQLGAVGYTQQLSGAFGDSATSLTIRPWVAGSYLTAIDHLAPQPNWDSGDPDDGYGIQIDMWGYTTRHAVVWWTGEGSLRSAEVPDQGVTTVHTATPNLQEVEAVLFFGTTGYGTEQQLGPPCAYHFGVLTNDYQGCVMYDLGVGTGGGQDGTPRYFQSSQYCYAANMYAGIRTASGEISGNQVLLTGEIEDSPDPRPAIFMNMYGGGAPASSMWMMEV